MEFLKSLLLKVLFLLSLLFLFLFHLSFLILLAYDLLLSFLLCDFFSKRDLLEELLSGGKDLVHLVLLLVKFVCNL